MCLDVDDLQTPLDLRSTARQRIGIHRIRLMNGQRVEAERNTSCRSDLRQGQVLMIKHRDLVGLQLAQHLTDARLRIEVHHGGQGVDEQPHHRLGTGKICGSARHRLAEGHHPVAAQARQEHRPRQLQDRGQGRTVRATHRFQRLTQLRTDREIQVLGH